LEIGLIIGLIYGQIGALIFGPIFGLIDGFKSEIKAREIPNQGIKQSVKNTLILPLIVCPCGLLIVPLLYLAPVIDFDWIESLRLYLCFLLSLGLIYGARDWIPHLTLRLILYQRGVIPWDYAQFL